MARRLLDQLADADLVPPVGNDPMSTSLMEALGVAGGVIVRTPAAYLGAPPSTPRGVARPAVLWDDVVLTVDDGKEAVFYGETLIWHLAQLCERCGTLLLPRSAVEGLMFIDNRDDLIAALDGSYRAFVPDCGTCRGPSVVIPTYGRQRDCESKPWRKKAAHNFTHGSPGPWNSGDIVWCLDCGKQATTKPYLDVFFQPPQGGGGGF